MSQENSDRNALIRILQNAYSGELAAAYAYRGHWKSVRDCKQKTDIRKIEEEEWLHRKEILEFLEFLNAKPKKWREVVFLCIGRTLGFFCYVSGWFFPMFFAGRLETQNVDEYAQAKKYALRLGLNQMANCLQNMSDTELEHEKYFYEIIADHWLLPVMKKFFRVEPVYKKSKL